MILATTTTAPNSSANSRTRQVIGASLGSRRPPGSSHSSRSFSRSTTQPASTRTPLIDTGKFIRCLRTQVTRAEIDPRVLPMISAAMPPSSNCNLIVWLRSPAQRQQNCRNQQQSTERQPHPSLGQAAGERDASGDRRDAAKCERQPDKPIDPTGPGIRQQRQERARGNERQRQTLRLQLPQPEERRQQRRRNEGTTDPE